MLREPGDDLYLPLKAFMQAAEPEAVEDPGAKGACDPSQQCPAWFVHESRVIMA